MKLLLLHMYPPPILLLAGCDSLASSLLSLPLFLSSQLHWALGDVSKHRVALPPTP